MAAPDIRVVPATEAHAAELVGRMRAEEASDIEASFGLPPLKVAVLSIQASEAAWAVTLDGDVAALMGVSRASREDDGAHVLWAHTSDVTTRHPKAFLRASRAILDALLVHYPHLVNTVDARRTTALRWARWLGFSVKPPTPGADGKDVCAISIRRT